MIVVVYGSTLHGQHRNAQSIAKAYGLSRIVESWDGVANLSEGTLAFTTADQSTIPARYTAVPFSVAMSKVGK